MRKILVLRSSCRPDRTTWHRAYLIIFEPFSSLITFLTSEDCKLDQSNPVGEVTSPILAWRGRISTMGKFKLNYLNTALYFEWKIVFPSYPDRFQEVTHSEMNTITRQSYLEEFNHNGFKNILLGYQFHTLQISMYLNTYRWKWVRPSTETFLSAGSVAVKGQLTNLDVYCQMPQVNPEREFFIPLASSRFTGVKKFHQLNQYSRYNPESRQNRMRTLTACHENVRHEFSTWISLWSYVEIISSTQNWWRASPDEEVSNGRWIWYPGEFTLKWKPIKSQKESILIFHFIMSSQKKFTVRPGADYLVWRSLSGRWWIWRQPYTEMSLSNPYLHLARWQIRSPALLEDILWMWIMISMGNCFLLTSLLGLIFDFLRAEMCRLQSPPFQNRIGQTMNRKLNRQGILVIFMTLWFSTWRPVFRWLTISFPA